MPHPFNHNAPTLALSVTGYMCNTLVGEIWTWTKPLLGYLPYHTYPVPHVMTPPSQGSATATVSGPSQRLSADCFVITWKSSPASGHM